MLVDGRARLSTDPCEYYDERVRELVGCAQLRCIQCEASVRTGPLWLVPKQSLQRDGTWLIVDINAKRHGLAHRDQSCGRWVVDADHLAQARGFGQRQAHRIASLGQGRQGLPEPLGEIEAVGDPAGRDHDRQVGVLHQIGELARLIAGIDRDRDRAGHGNAEAPAALTWLWRDYDPAKMEQTYTIDPAEKGKPFYRVKTLNRD